MSRVIPLATAVALLVAVPSTAGPDKVSFPSDYRSHVRYWTVDRAINDTVRMFYASPDVVRMARPAQPLPSGTVITMEVYKAKLDDQRKPLKDAKGRFIKSGLVSIMVMEKRAGWGAEYPDDIRNGEWEYAQFEPDGTPSQPADTSPCFQCHKRMSKQDFVFSLPQLRAAPK